MCVWGCVCERERERVGGRERKRKRERERERFLISRFLQRWEHQGSCISLLRVWLHRDPDVARGREKGISDFLILTSLRISRLMQMIGRYYASGSKLYFLLICLMSSQMLMSACLDLQRIAVTWNCSEFIAFVSIELPSRADIARQNIDTYFQIWRRSIPLSSVLLTNLRWLILWTRW